MRYTRYISKRKELIKNTGLKPTTGRNRPKMFINPRIAALVEAVKSNPRLTKEQADFATQTVTFDTALYMPHQTEGEAPETLSFGSLLTPEPWDDFCYRACDDAWDALQQVFVNFGCYDQFAEDCDEEDRIFQETVRAGIPLFMVAAAFDAHLSVIGEDGKPAPLPFKNWNRFTTSL